MRLVLAEVIGSSRETGALIDVAGQRYHCPFHTIARTLPIVVLDDGFARIAVPDDVREVAGRLAGDDDIVGASEAAAMLNPDVAHRILTARSQVEIMDALRSL